MEHSVLSMLHKLFWASSLREIICQKFSADQVSADHWQRIKPSVLKNQELSSTQSPYFTIVFRIQLNRDYGSLSPVTDLYIMGLNLLILYHLWAFFALNVMFLTFIVIFVSYFDLYIFFLLYNIYWLHIQYLFSCLDHFHIFLLFCCSYHITEWIVLCASLVCIG